MNLASFASFLFSTSSMSAPTESNKAMNEVPVPEVNMSDDEIIVDVEALQGKAQKALDATLAAAKVKNEEIMHKQKEKEDWLEEERKQAKVDHKAKRVMDEAAVKK